MRVFGKCKGDGRRSAPREATPLIAVFTTITRSHRAVVVDVSATGVRLRGCDLPRRGDLLDITIENVRAFGTVVWSDQSECGIAFEEPLCSADVALLRDRVSGHHGVAPEIKAALDDWVTGMAR